MAIKALPKGAECYEALLRNYHSARIGAERTYARGQAAVAAHTAAVIERGKAIFGESDFTAILRRVNEGPENRFKSEEELIEATRALVPVTREKVAPFFTQLPAQELIVEPFPEFLKGTGQSSRYEQKSEAEGPATYRIATDDWETQTRARATIVVVHEGWPGHHLQIATARGMEGLHPATRLASSGAYIEGWARYAEALAEEAGIYEGGYGEITRRAWPARGMVMDPGLHLYGWTREQAVAYAMESGNFTRGDGRGSRRPHRRMAGAAHGVRHRRARDLRAPEGSRGTPRRRLRHPRIPRARPRERRASARRVARACRGLDLEKEKAGAMSAATANSLLNPMPWSSSGSRRPWHQEDLRSPEPGAAQAAGRARSSV